MHSRSGRAASAAAIVALAALGLVAARPAAAQTAVFTLDNVLFDDGTYATGTFTYDATDNSVLDYDITTTAGQGIGLGNDEYPIPAFEFTPSDSAPTIYGGPTDGYIQISFLTSPVAPEYILAFAFDQPLTFNASNPMDGNDDGVSFEQYSPGSPGYRVRQILSGSADPAPEPSSLAMAVAAVGMFAAGAFVRRRGRCGLTGSRLA